jgi:hypothetical protein
MASLMASWVAYCSGTGTCSRMPFQTKEGKVLGGARDDGINSGTDSTRLDLCREHEPASRLLSLGPQYTAGSRFVVLLCGAFSS